MEGLRYHHWAIKICHNSFSCTKGQFGKSARTRRLNSSLSRRNSLQNLQKNTLRTASNAATSQGNVVPVLARNSFPSKLPLPRHPTVGPLQNHPCVNKTTCSEGNETINGCQTSSAGQSVACTVSSVNLLMPCATQVTVTPRSGVSSVPPIHPSTDSLTDSLLDLTNSNTLCNDNNTSHSGGEHSVNHVPPSVIVIDETAREAQEAPNELELRSPKRKGAQPKKRVCESDPSSSSLSTVGDSPVKPDQQSVNQTVAMDITCTPNSLTPQSFLGTLLNTPLLQEKMAENINKIVCSTRSQIPSDELVGAFVTTTEASSEDLQVASNQGCGGDIPVKEIMDLMQADPAFDVLFSCFGLDALDALPSATEQIADQLPSVPVDGNTCIALDKSTSSQQAFDLQESSHHLNAPSSQPEVSSGFSAAPQPSNPQQNATSSSPTSDLHLSAANIVTDALLLLAGSPPKKTPTKPRSTEHCYSNAHASAESNSDSLPRVDESPPNRHRMDDKQPRVKSIENQPALITSTLPFVRALNFAAEKETVPKKRAPKKGSKKKSSPKQFINSNGQSETTKKAESNDAGQAVAKNLSRQSALPTSLEPSFPITSSVVNSIVTSTTSGINGQILPRQGPAVVTIPTSSSSSSPLLTVNSTHDLSPVDGNLGGPSFSPDTYGGVAPSPLLPSNHVPIVTTTGLAPNNTTSACSTSTTVDSTAIATSFRASKQHPSHNSSSFAPTFSSPYTALATSLAVSKAYSDVTSKSVFAASSGSVVASCVPTISCPATENLISHSTGICQAALSDHSTVDIIVPSKSCAEDPALSQGDRTFKASSGSTTSGFSDESLQLIQASSLLETLAQQCANDSVNSPTSREDAVPVSDGVVNTKGQSFNENSASCLNTTIAKDSSTISDENREGEGSSCANVMVQESECVEASLQNPQGNQSDCTSSLSVSDSYCRGHFKENSLTSRWHSPNNRESKAGGTSCSHTKRQRDVAQSQKKRKTKSLRPAKRLKTREEGINFPTDLNVEEFLATLRYEVQ
ncbi:uncharacterized protein [Acropora muricata]|uniref:uncharacterized protein isoform X3 n=1 Tax=Acropora muricata TaxID=159855 RepID=UPI0034E47320